MARLTINNSIVNFLNRNKVRFMAIGTATIMASTMPACTYNSNNSTYISDTNDLNKEQQDLKAHILDYITNMDVYKNEGVGEYYIYEKIYREDPIYSKDGNVLHYEKIFVEYNQLFISFEDAELLELTELLELRVVWKQKVK